LPFTGFFSGKLVPPKEEPVAPKEKQAATLPPVRFFSGKLAPPKEEPVVPKEGKAASLPFVGFFSGKPASPKEKTTLPPPAAPPAKGSVTFSLVGTRPKKAALKPASVKAALKKAAPKKVAPKRLSAKASAKVATKKVATKSTKQVVPVHDSPSSKTKKGANPFCSLFSPTPKKAKKATAKGKGTVSLTEAAAPKKKAGGFSLFSRASHKPAPTSLTRSCSLLQNYSSCANSTKEPSNVLMVSPGGREGTVGRVG
jgi:hypothetical protein